jgi:hypothetical protein
MRRLLGHLSPLHRDRRRSRLLWRRHRGRLRYGAVLLRRRSLGLHGQHGTILRLLALRLLWLRARLRLGLLWSSWAGLCSVFTASRRYRLKRTWLILRLALFRTSGSLGHRSLLIRLRTLLLRALRRRHRVRGQNCGMPRDFIRTRRWSMVLGLQGLGGDDLRRPPAVYAGELRAIRFELPRVLNLRLNRREAPLAHHGHFLGHWSRRHSAGTTVIAHAIRRDIRGAVIVDIADHRSIHVRDGVVVDEVAASPIAAVESAACVAVAIVNSSIETDVRSPIASMPQIAP